MKETSTRRVILTSKELAYDALTRSDKYLYDVLNQNIDDIRRQMLVPGNTPDAKIGLFTALNDCKDLQNKLISEIQSSDDTQAVDLKEYQKSKAYTENRSTAAPRSSEDTQDINIRGFKKE